MKVKILPNQTLSDIAVQEYGSEDAVFALAKENDISVTEELTPGAELKCPSVVFNSEMQKYCRDNGVSPGTMKDSDSNIMLRIFTDEFTEEFK